MPKLFAQGDILLELVDDIMPSGTPLQPASDGVFVLAEGETTGHRHVIHERIAFFRDDGLARDVPTGLYVGHVRVTDDAATLVHEEHAPIVLEKGTYRVRRQREMEPREARIVAD